MNKFNIGDTVRIKSTGDVFTVTGIWFMPSGGRIYHENDAIGAYEDKLELVASAALGIDTPDGGASYEGYDESVVMHQMNAELASLRRRVAELEAALKDTTEMLDARAEKVLDMGRDDAWHFPSVLERIDHNHKLLASPQRGE